MKLKETGLAERIFNLPATDMVVNEKFLKVKKNFPTLKTNKLFFQFYQSHLIPYAKPDKNITVEDVRRDLDMVENIDDELENVSFCVI